MKKLNNLEIMFTLDEILNKRESLKSSLKHTNNLVHQGIEMLGKLPNRWYVRNPSNKIINYLSKKYKMEIPNYKNMDIGLGELHGQYAFVPHDVDYSWEITEDEFCFGMSLEQGNENDK